MQCAGIGVECEAADLHTHAHTHTLALTPDAAFDYGGENLVTRALEQVCGEGVSCVGWDSRADTTTTHSTMAVKT